MPKLPGAVWLLSWVSFFADVSSEMVYPLLPLFLVAVLGASRAQLGLSEGAAMLLVALLTAFAGWRSDRIGRRVPWLRFGYGLPVLGKTMLALANAWPMALGGRLLDRCGKGLRSAPRDALLADVVPAGQRGQAFGVHRALDTAGALVGVLLAALLLWWFTGSPRQGGAAAATAHACRVVFGIAAALGLLSLALTLLVREAERPQPRTAAATSTAPSAAAVAGWLGLPRSYWAVLALMVTFALGNSSDTFLLLRASDLGLSPWAVVLGYALCNCVYAAVSYPAGAWSDRIGRWRIIAIGWAIYAVVYAGFAFAPAGCAWSMWPLLAIYGAYLGLCDGVGKALIADQVPAGRRGTAMGLFHAATGATALVSSVAAGWLWDRYGPTPAFLAGAGCALLALAALPLVRGRERAGS